MNESNDSSATLHRKEQDTAVPSTPLLHSSNPTPPSWLPAQREDDSPNGQVASSLSSLRLNNNIQQQQQQRQEPPTKQGAAAAATAEDEKARVTASSPSSAAKAVTSGSPFLTTSDIIRHLNKALAETPSAPPVAMPSEYDDDDDNMEDYMEDEPLEQDQAWNNEHHDTSTKARPAAALPAAPPPPPQFELHRRLPDGSTRRVSPSEQEAADLESKLQQVVAHIAPLPPTQQWEWIHNEKS
ncbi:hypothetical protein ACA910_021352 [Epithemia clementina (nom. ined.)]